ncbi:MAG: hypothetical protein A2X64_05640 [Ignavibacteria bacterium GWF2_33_9]|nr:MAG: hypothetical protein A2X64_05640 [Ignavibacteria bacterium GWF2_33_9]
MNDIFEKIEREDLTEDLTLIADAMGIDVVRNLMRTLSGMYIYIPRVSRLERFVKRYMTENAERPFKEIALDLNVSSQYLWKLRRNSGK